MPGENIRKFPKNYLFLGQPEQLESSGQEGPPGPDGESGGPGGGL